MVETEVTNHAYGRHSKSLGFIDVNWLKIWAVVRIGTTLPVIGRFWFCSTWSLSS